MKQFRKKLVRRLLALCTAFTAVSATLPSVHANALSAVNLVAGLPYTVHTGVGIGHSYMLTGTETDPAEGKLTDGKRASTNAFDDPAWHKCYRGLSRTVEFAFPDMRLVTGFSVSLLQCNAAGLPMPPSFDLYISENGTDWMLAGSYDATPLQSAAGTVKRELRAENLGRFRAAYVRLSFRVSVNVFLDEIEVYGFEEIPPEPDGSETPFVRTEEPVCPEQYDAGIEGCREMVLLYCGFPGDYAPSAVENTEEEMLYYFGYVAEDGTVQDTFFDSFLFSALRGAAPSGGNFNESNGTQTTMEDWEYFLDSIFDETYNCGAIERAMETVKAATGKSDATVSMVINVPYPTIGSRPFGDLNGDGKAEYCRNEEEQLAIYDWFFTRVEQRMAERNYRNIRLGGFYWGEEGLALEARDTSLLKNVAALVHAHGTDFFWIPFLYGNGFDQTRELGFDCAMMQPNYSFLEYAEEECFGEIDEAVRKYGLGIELEIHWNVSIDDAYLARWYSYLNAGYALGYQYGVAHSYYQNADPGTFYHLARSGVRKLRNAYDDTYAFVKGTYEPRKITLTVRETSIRAGETARGYLRPDTGCCAATLGDWTWKILEEPGHGTLELNREGVYSYRPADGFIGTDTFTVCMAAAYASSEPLTVHVEVKAAEETSREETSSGEVSAPPAPSADRQKTPVWPWVTAGGVLAMAVAAGVLRKVFRRKRK